MPQAPLMQRAQERAPKQQAGGFKKPDPSTFIPEGSEDAVQRVVAAGMKTMYSPAMREELANEINRDVPIPQKLAEGVVGLVLTLDKQTQGGIPMAAIFPAILMLLGEAAELLTNAGQPVSQEDYNEAAQMAYALTAEKMGHGKQEIMSSMEQLAANSPDAAPEQPGEAQPGMPQELDEQEA